MQAGIVGWDTANKAPVRVLVDSLGHLQVDTLSSALPTGAATEATLDLVRAELDGIETLLGGGLPAALATGALKVREQGTPSVHLYGYDGAAWQTLLTESDTLKNLRVKLYDGANGIASFDLDTCYDVPLSGQGLATRSIMWVWRSGSDFRAVACAGGVGDNTSFLNSIAVGLFGYDGFYWDRLRTYGTGILKVGRAEIGATLARETGTGSVATGAKKLMWITIRPSAANWVLALTDDTAGGGTVIWDEGGALQEPCHCIFDPPIEFATGIYIETFTNLTSVAFSYV